MSHIPSEKHIGILLGDLLKMLDEAVEQDAVIVTS